MSIKIGIIGGTGLSDPDILKNGAEQEVDTPYGKPSDTLKTGEISGVPCVLLARHGRGHSIMPTNVNFRANIWALKQVGCTHVLVTTACGSLKEQIKPGHIVFLSQFIDRTQKRIQTFFDGSENAPRGICHMPMREPFCPRTSQILYDCAKELGIECHKEGTMVTIEGPRFSSKAESKLFCSWGIADCIGMTTVPEVILAKEAGLIYASMALVTDYDSWREDDNQGVNIENVNEMLKLSSADALKVLRKAIPLIGEQDWSDTIKKCQDMVKENTMLPH